MAQLRREQDRFEAAGVQVVLVGMGTPEESEEFRRTFKVPFPLVSNPDKSLYRAFDLKRMGALGFLSPTMAIKGLAVVARGHTIGRPTGDVRQLPGVFVIDTAGQIVLSHYGSGPEDHPSAESLLTVLENRINNP